jgi:hypothetical protein
MTRARKQPAAEAAVSTRTAASVGAEATDTAAIARGAALVEAVRAGRVKAYVEE